MRDTHPKQQLHRSLGHAAQLALLAAVSLSLGWTLLLKPDPDVANGNRLVKKGKAKKALEAYEEAEKRLGRRPKLDYNRGLAYFGLGKYKKAQESFLSAGGSDDPALRRKAFYNLANTLYKLAEPTIQAAAKSLGPVQALHKQLTGQGAPADPKARCQLMQKILQGLKRAGAAQEARRTAFRKAFEEYHRVLKKSPSFFDAKWNLELSLRQMSAAELAHKQLAETEKRLAERYQKECKPKDDKNKKKNQDKKNQDKKKQDQNKQKQKQDKQKQKQDQDKQKQDQDKQKQKQNQKPRKQKPLTKEDIARKKAAQELDKLERRQRERDRRRARSGTTQQPQKDW